MRSQILVALVALVVAAQVCCCCSIAGGPEPPYTIAPSADAASRFEERMNAVDLGADDSFTITITEEEMTSLIRQGLAEQKDTPLSEIQAYFRNNRVEVYATVQMADSLALPGMVAFSLASTDGQVAVTVEEVTLGPLPVPEPVLQSLNDELNKALSESIQIDGKEVAITDVQIGEGEMTVSGQAPSD